MYRVAELKESWEVTKEVKAFRLSKGFDFTLGQFVMVGFQGSARNPSA